MKGMNYSDVLAMPTYERRFFLGQLVKDINKKEEHFEKMKEESKVKNGKGNRTTKISGQQLKNKLKTGEIPIG
jgi:hypothetical protein